MKNKQIVFTAPGCVELLEKDIPTPRADEVVAKLAFSTISSGTERANLAGVVNVSREITDGKAHFPRYAGYSSAGVVVAVGEGVRSVKPGDRVALSWSVHSNYTCVKEEFVHLLPDNVSFEEGALVQIATFPLAAIRKCALEIGESAIVMGVGVLGMMAIQLLRVAGAAPIIAADPDEGKRKLALTLGADYALDPMAPNFAEEVKRLSHGGIRVAIEVTGVGVALNQVLDCMQPFGRVALLGCTRNSNFTVDYYHKVHGPGISLIGAHTLARPTKESSHGLWTTHDDSMALLHLIAGGRFSLASLVSETHKPEEAPAVYQRLLTEKTFPVVQFDWRDDA
ncbi:MAG: zinc-binding alcohol dehydrogenase [Clostridia bacterium]|nr:zinc-binding alcohol dehydrogenase [Clostridia bacterium]